MTLFNDDAQHQYTDEELAQVIAESKEPELDPRTIQGALPELEQRPELTDSQKIDYLYESAVKIRELIDQLKPEEIERVQKTMANPLVKKLMGLK